MKRSTRRILTTHTGSLPRPPDLFDMIRAREAGHKVDTHALAARVQSAVEEIVRKQVELGIDVVSDGEMSKPAFNTYVAERLTGWTEVEDLSVVAEVVELLPTLVQLEFEGRYAAMLSLEAK